MQSHSRSHFHPALSNRVPDRALTSSLEADQQLSPDQARPWSFQEPPLAVGDYSLSVSQQIQLPEPGKDEHERPPPPKILSIPNKSFHVSGPKFKFSDPADLHSVYPAAGHSAYARTLAHAVFSHPATPWERDITDGEKCGFNKLPWVGILSFTEDELVSDPAEYQRLAFEDDEVSAEYGSVSVKASRLAELQNVVNSVPTAPGAKTDFKPNDEVSMLLLKPILFKKIFTSYDADNNHVWSGKADLSRFAMMAHVEETHGGFTARTYADETPTEQPQHSIVVSPRTGKPGLASTTRVISHIISLEDIDKIVLAGDDNSNPYIGLVSLYSWDWMSVPEDAVDFEHVMAELGKTVQPLRIEYEEEKAQFFPDESSEADDEPSSTEAVNWLRAKFDAGYVFKPHTAITGVKTESLIRGPLIPALSKREPRTSSLYGEGLALFDEETGIPDVSDQSAWTLGRSMVMADRTLTASLLRLRGRVHAEAVRQAKADALTGNGYEMVSSQDIYLSNLEDAMQQLEDAQDVTGLNSRSNAAARWARTEDDRAGLLVKQLSNETFFTLTKYINHVDAITLAMFGSESEDSPDTTRTIDSDAAAVRAWVIDRFMLAGIPLHSLVLHPNMLPQESIRTFFVDQHWINRLVDGGLSLANHFARDDDAIRRAIKASINKYLETPIGNDPDATTPQLPRWGFFMRSIAVSAFPDLKVEAPLPPEAPANTREVLFMQVLADDILICLFDRLPGERGFDYIRICQPHHQQGFALGTRLLQNELHGIHRGVPTTQAEVTEEVVMNSTSTSPIQVYDFDTRMLRPDMYTGVYLKTMEGKANVFQWPVEDRVRPPASLLATQLKTVNLRLTLTMDNKDSSEGDHLKDDAPSDRWKRPAAQLTLSPRPDLNKSVPIKDSPRPNPSRRAPPANVTLPAGPRRRVHELVFTSADFADTSEQDDIEELNHASQGPPEPRLGLEKLTSKRLKYKHLPAEATCFLCYEPGSTTNIIYATDTPTDLVFKLSGDEYPNPPAQLEIRIPVALSSGVYPSRVNGRSQGLLVIPGTSTKPLLPVLEHLDPGHQWSHTSKLAQGHLYAIPPGQPPTSGDSVPSQYLQCIMLVITVTPRLTGPLPNKAKMYNWSFILRGVSFVIPKQDGSAQPRDIPSRTTQFDVLRKDLSLAGDEAMSVRSTGITIRPAIIVSIVADKTNYDFDAKKLNISYDLSHLPPMASQLRLTALVDTSNGEESAVLVVRSLPLPADPVEKATQGTYHFQSTYDMKPGEVPLDIRLAILSEKNEAMGPDSVPFLFPRLPSIREIQSHCFGWKDDRLNICWTPPKATHLPYVRTYTFLNSDLKTRSSHSVSENAEAGVITVEEADLVQYMGNLKRIAFDMAVKAAGNLPIHGTLFTSEYMIARWPTPQNLPLKMQSEKKIIAAPPLQTSGVGSMRFWKDKFWIDSEAWYWSSSNTLAGILCTYDSDSRKPYTRDAVSPITGVAGAGSLAPFHMDKTNRSKIVWIGIDGSVNMSSREGHEFPGTWETTTIAPSGSASVLGGGTLAVCADFTIDRFGDHVPRGTHNPAFWWVGPRGEICGRRSAPDPTTGSENWVDIGPEASLPAGSIDVSPSLTRPAQMAAIWTFEQSQYSDDAYLFWVSLEGDLMVTCASPTTTVHSERISKTGLAYRNIDAAPGTALAAHIGHGVGHSPDLYVHWIGIDGSVFVGRSPLLWKSVDGPHQWLDILTIASPGAANPLTQLRVVGSAGDSFRALVWANALGQPHVAISQVLLQDDLLTEWMWTELYVDEVPDLNPRISVQNAKNREGWNTVYIWWATGQWSSFVLSDWEDEEI